MEEAFNELFKKSRLLWGDYYDFLKKQINATTDSLEKKYLEQQLRAVKKEMETEPRPQVARAFTLFYDTRHKKGFALPLRFARSFEDKIITHSTTRTAIENAWLAVQHTCGVYFPDRMFDLAFDISEPPAFSIDGQSLGLSAAVMIISQYFQRPIPADVAFSACIEVNGQLTPVDFFDEKAAGVQKHLKYINQIICAGSQTISKSFTKPEIVPCQSLEEALIHLWGQEFLTQTLIPERENPERLFQALLFYEKMQNNPAVDQLLDRIIEEFAQAKRPSLKTIYVYALAEKGLQLTHKSRLSEAKGYFEQARKELTKLGDHLDPAIPVFEVFNKYGVWLTDNYRFKEAESYFKRALKLLKRYRHPPYRLINTMNSLGQLYAKTGRRQEAETLFLESLKIADQTEEYDDRARIYCYLAENQILAGQFEQAEVYLHQADGSLSPKKEIQRLFNAFWRAMLYFRKNDAASFARYWGQWQKESWFLEAREDFLHVQMIKAYAVSLLNLKETDYFVSVVEYFARQRDVLTLLLLAQIDACHFLRHNDLMFYDKQTVLNIVRQAKKHNSYLKKQLPAELDSAESWRALCKVICF
ncbi:tetratricopeptide repeat protein [Caldithrix abyssi]